ncbi:hypothetical protein BUL40_12630 [Croceivirga radicis]|uniref:Uncharacterized protein n=1 Tax=Croceivirga radicis TaxID=1929488 RepID=A0A1V6LP26_9FLAO|nr:hypothetical protein [Croceivirga radicis]OQD41955.1 hypothetical protein BUL40_12630 [Croceivirga radicis]
MTKEIKHNLSYVFLALFLTVKMAGLHVFTHTDEADATDDCAICEVVFLDTHTPVLPENGSEWQLDVPTINYLQLKVTSAPQSLSNTLFSYFQFSRPPPHLLA